MEDKHFWSFGRQQALVEHDLKWKTNFNGRHPLMENYVRSNNCNKNLPHYTIKVSTEKQATVRSL